MLTAWEEVSSLLGAGKNHHGLVVDADESNANVVMFSSLLLLHTFRLVNDLLERDIGKMHGLTLKTITPAAWAAAKQAQA